MKVFFITPNRSLMDELTAVIPTQRDLSIAYNSSEVEKVVKQNETDYDYIVVDEAAYKGHYPWEWMTFLRENSPKASIILVANESSDSLYTELTKRLAVDLEISIIPLGLTQSEIAEEVSRRLFNQKKKAKDLKGRVVTVVSASSKDGATTVALSSAMALAKATNKKVGLLDLNLKSPEIRDFISVKGEKGFPLIQADVDAGMLDAESLIRATEQFPGYKNLYVLTGLLRREWAEKISIKEIAFLLEVAREAFDIVFVDVHSFPDNAATVRAVLDADERWLVVSPVVTSYQSSFHDWFNSVWAHYDLEQEDFKIIINRFDKEFATVSDVEKSTGAKVIAQISNVGLEKGIKAINYGEPLFMSNDDELEGFKNDIYKLAERAAANIGVADFDTFKIGKKKKGVVATMFPFLLVK